MRAIDFGPAYVWHLKRKVVFIGAPLGDHDKASLAPGQQLLLCMHQASLCVFGSTLLRGATISGLCQICQSQRPVTRTKTLSCEVDGIYPLVYMRTCVP